MGTGAVPYNPYAANGGSPNVETSPLDVVMRQAIDAKLLNVHTCLPAKITNVRGNNAVDLQLLLQRVYVNGQVVSIQQVQNVPVYVPRGTDYWLKLPIAVNDLGLALFSERSLDRWKVNANNGEPIDPQDNRKFDYTDAIFLPGLYPFNQQVAGNATDMVLHNGQAEIYLEKAGKFKIQQVGGNELLDLLVQLATACSNISNSAGPTLNAADFTALSNQISELQG